jgi:catechol-2,3-dioxygenase
MNGQYDHATEDIGNIVALEHVNIRVPDQRLATLFYISGLGLTRDPYLMTGVTNMWVNVGRGQFHLPTGEAQVLRGRIGLVLPDLDTLEGRLAALRAPLDGTRFDFSLAENHVDVTCPWGNRIRCHAPDARFGAVALAMPYLEFDVPEGAAEGIARFYDVVLNAPAVAESGTARVAAGAGQTLVFRESAAAPAPYDGHHIQIYVADFSGPHGRLGGRGLITEESNRYQYRFKDIVDPASGAMLFTVEHEVRSMTHPLYSRPLVNRNPDQTNAAFAAGHEERPWALPFSD